MAFAEHTFAQVPFAGVINLFPTLVTVPSSPFSLSKDTPIAPIAINVDDPNLGSVTLSEFAGSLPTGLSYSEALPKSAAVPYSINIIGTPTVVGPYSVTLRIDDGIGAVLDTVLSFNVVESKTGAYQAESNVSESLVSASDIALSSRNIDIRKL